MQDNYIEEFLDLKKEILTTKRPTNIDDAVSFYNKLIPINKYTEKIKASNLEYIGDAFDLENIDVKYIGSIVKNYKKLITDNKTSFKNGDDFLKEIFSGDTLSTVISRSKKDFFGLTPTQITENLPKMIEVMKNNTNEEVLNEYVTNIGKEIVIGINADEAMAENKNAKITEIYNDPDKKNDFIAKSGLSKEEADKLLTDAYNATKNVKHSITDQKLSQAVASDSIITKINREKARNIYENELSKKEKEFFFVDAEGAVQYKGTNTKEEGENLLKKYNYSPTNECLQKLVPILNKVVEYGWYDNNFKGEDSKKVYAFRKYVSIKNSLVNETDPTKLKGLLEEFNTERQRIKEVSKLCREAFGTDVFPGNVDVSRNDFIDYELSSDIPGTSWLNSMFVIASSIKTANASVEDYLKSPVKYVNQMKQKYIDESYPNKIQDYSRDEAFKFLLQKHNEKGGYPIYLFGRTLDAIVMADRTTTVGPIASSITLQMASTVNKFWDNNFIENSHTEEAKQTSYERVAAITLIENPTDYTDLYSGIINQNTGELIKFDPKNYLETHEVDLNVLQNRLANDIKYVQTLDVVTKMTVMSSYKKLAQTIITEKNINPNENSILNELSKIKDFTLDEKYHHHLDKNDERELNSNIDNDCKWLYKKIDNYKGAKVLFDINDTSEKEVEEVLYQLNDMIEEHNPWYMKMRNLFSSGPYSSILDEIHEALDSDLTDKNVIVEKLTSINNKCQRYLNGKMTDGKKDTDLNKNRINAVSLISATISKTLYQFTVDNNTHEIYNDNDSFDKSFNENDLVNDDPRLDFSAPAMENSIREQLDLSNEIDGELDDDEISLDNEKDLNKGPKEMGK